MFCDFFEEDFARFLVIFLTQVQSDLLKRKVPLSSSEKRRYLNGQ